MENTSTVKKEGVLVFLLGVVFVTFPLFFERLHSDEVIYWEVSRNIASGLGPFSSTLGGSYLRWHMPLPFYAVAPFLWISDHIFAARAVSSLFTAGCAFIIFLIARRDHPRDSAVVSALVFILSLQALRFGGRFYLDQYGCFFFLLSVYSMRGGRFFLSGLWSLAAVLSREYWIGVYPFLFFYSTGFGFKAGSRFILPLFFCLSGVVALEAISGGALLSPLWAFLNDGAPLKNMTASTTQYGAVEYLLRLARGWLEFSILNALAITGFVSWLYYGREWRCLLLVAPQILIISVIHGFVINGGVTQYPLGVLATIAPFSGPGLKRLYEEAPFIPFKKESFLAVGAFILMAQYATLNAVATSLTIHRNPSIYGFGFSDDAEVISLLRREAGKGLIHGIHGAFVGGSSWAWTDYLVQEAIEKDPDWFITFDNYVEVLPREGWSGRAHIYRIGPYIVVRALEKGSVRLAVREKGFKKWKLASPNPPAGRRSKGL